MRASPSLLDPVSVGKGGVVSVSRQAKVVLAAWLVFVVAGAGVWAWFLSRHGLDDDSAWSGVLQGFTSLLGVLGLVASVLALRTPSGDEADGRKGASQRVSQSVKIGKIKARGSVDINVRQGEKQP